MVLHDSKGLPNYYVRCQSLNHRLGNVAFILKMAMPVRLVGCSESCLFFQQFQGSSQIFSSRTIQMFIQVFMYQLMSWLNWGEEMWIVFVFIQVTTPSCECRLLDKAKSVGSKGTKPLNTWLAEETYLTVTGIHFPAYWLNSRKKCVPGSLVLWSIYLLGTFHFVWQHCFFVHKQFHVLFYFGFMPST